MNNMNKIPEWQYPLYEEPDKVAYSILEKLGKSKKYPKLTGSQYEINKFVKLLIISQKMKDYRRFRDITLNEFKKEKVNIPKILDESRNLEIPRGIDDSWVIFIQDKRICELIDEVRNLKIEFQGTNNKIVEFVVRFLLSQLLQDWRGPLMAVLLECSGNKLMKISKLNGLLKIWDYTEVFKVAAP